MRLLQWHQKTYITSPRANGAVFMKTIYLMVVLKALEQDKTPILYSLTTSLVRATTLILEMDTLFHYKWVLKAMTM